MFEINFIEDNGHSNNTIEKKKKALVGHSANRTEPLGHVKASAGCIVPKHETSYTRGTHLVVCNATTSPPKRDSEL